MATRERHRRPRQLNVGSVLSTSFSVWLRNIIPFTIVLVIVQLPLVIYTQIVFSNPATGNEELQRYTLIASLMGQLLSLIATGALIYGVIEQLAGKPAGIGRCLGVGLQRLFPVLGVGLVAGLLIGLGFMLLLVPGIFLYCMYYAAVPAAVVERPGVLGALSRSRQLTEGSKGTIFLIAFVLGVIYIGVSQVIQVGLLPDNATGIADLRTFMWVNLAWSIFWGGLQATVPAVVYHDLRISKEGIGVEDLKRVFA